MAAARREGSVLSRNEVSEQLYTLVNNVTDGIDGEVGLAVVSSSSALFELDEMSMNEFYQALEADEISEVVVLRHELEI